MATPPRSARDIMATIATEMGVTTRTVYRVLNEREGEVWSSAAERSERIRTRARELGYRPNLAARSTRTGRFAQVAFVMGFSTTASSFSDVFLKGLHDGLAQAELALVVARLTDDQLASSERLPAILRSLSVDGLMILYHTPESPAMRRALRDCRLPVVWLNDRRPQDCVHYDDEQGAAEAVRRLHTLGHRRIAYLNSEAAPGPTHHSRIDRRAGYLHAMTTLRLSVDIVALPIGPLYQQCEHWLRAHQHLPSAVVCYGMNHAQALLLAATRRGLRVPEDLSIVHCGQDEAQPMGVAFSRVYSEAYDCATTGARMMLSKLEYPRRRIPAIAMPYRWWDAGETCGEGPGS